MYYEIEALQLTKYPDKMLILSKLLFLENSTKLFFKNDFFFLVGNPWTFGTESPDDTGEQLFVHLFNYCFVTD